MSCVAWVRTHWALRACHRALIGCPWCAVSWRAIPAHYSDCMRARRRGAMACQLKSHASLLQPPPSPPSSSPIIPNVPRRPGFSDDLCLHFACIVPDSLAVFAHMLSPPPPTSAVQHSSTRSPSCNSLFAFYSFFLLLSLTLPYPHPSPPPHALSSTNRQSAPYRAATILTFPFTCSSPHSCLATSFTRIPYTPFPHFNTPTPCAAPTIIIPDLLVMVHPNKPNRFLFNHPGTKFCLQLTSHCNNPPYFTTPMEFLRSKHEI